MVQQINTVFMYPVAINNFPSDESVFVSLCNSVGLICFTDTHHKEWAGLSHVN